MPKRKQRDPITFEDAYALFSSIYNRPGYSELESVDDACVRWKEQAPCVPTQRKLKYRRTGEQAWRFTGRYASCFDGKSCNKRNFVKIEDAYNVFSPLYNKVNFSELEPLETARLYWEEQVLTMSTRRHLRYRRLGEACWRTTGTYSDCLNGKTCNKTPEEAKAKMKASHLLIPPELRQQHYLEERAFRAAREELDLHADYIGKPRLRWLSLPDGLKADGLVQMSDTTNPNLWTAVQIKSSSHARKFAFNRTAGYSMPLLCLAFHGAKIQEWLLFDYPLERKTITVTLGCKSQHVDVERAKTTVAHVYEFLTQFPAVNQRKRDYWVFDRSQTSDHIFRGLEVQSYCEKLLGSWVESPWAQGMAIDAYITLDGVRIAISFKSATPQKAHYSFGLGVAPNHKEVQVFIVGFRENDRVTSLGVMAASAIDWAKTAYCWSTRKPFAGIVNIRTGDQLREALRKFIPRAEQ